MLLAGSALDSFRDQFHCNILSLPSPRAHILKQHLVKWTLTISLWILELGKKNSAIAPLQSSSCWCYCQIVVVTSGAVHRSLSNSRPWVRFGNQQHHQQGLLTGLLVCNTSEIRRSWRKKPQEYWVFTGVRFCLFLTWKALGNTEFETFLAPCGRLASHQVGSKCIVVTQSGCRQRTESFNQTTLTQTFQLPI